jgi:hypothetical protein
MELGRRRAVDREAKGAAMTFEWDCQCGRTYRTLVGLWAHRVLCWLRRIRAIENARGGE